jgi:hypothetical protein
MIMSAFSNCDVNVRRVPNMDELPTSTDNRDLKVRSTRRIARGYRTFDHYRL